MGQLEDMHIYQRVVETGSITKAAVPFGSGLSFCIIYFLLVDTIRLTTE
jgi:hypothetical protein